MSGRSPEEIRASIEANRTALAVSIGKLRGEVAEITDWRKQLNEHQRPALISRRDRRLRARRWHGGLPSAPPQLSPQHRHRGPSDPRPQERR